MSAVRIVTLVLLIALFVAVAVLSQLDTVTIGKVYKTASHFLHVDLKALKIKPETISNTGHLIAGFSLCALGHLVLRRWWVLPVTLAFFVALEVAQHFSPSRQADFFDILRGWLGAGLGFMVAHLAMKIRSRVSK